MINELITILDSSGCSCVIAKEGDIRSYTQRGIADLYYLSKNEAQFLNGATMVDKVVGKGAATLIAASKIKELYTHVISSSAHKLLTDNGVVVSYKELVPNIQNRDKTGFCPLETRCKTTDSLDELLKIIDNFISEISK